MAKGDNKCKSCGQFSGRGHKCPATDTQFVSPANKQQSPSPARADTNRAEVDDRVARAQFRLAQPAKIAVPQVREALDRLRTHGPSAFSTMDRNMIAAYVGRRADGAEHIQEVLQEPVFKDDPKRTQALQKALDIGLKQREALPTRSIDRQVDSETGSGWGANGKFLYPQEFIDEVVGYYIKNEVSSPETARKFGISYATMDSWLKARGIKKRPVFETQIITPEKRQAVIEEYFSERKRNPSKQTHTIATGLAKKHRLQPKLIQQILSEERERLRNEKAGR